MPSNRLSLTGLFTAFFGKDSRRRRALALMFGSACWASQLIQPTSLSAQNSPRSTTQTQSTPSQTTRAGQSGTTNATKNGNQAPSGGSASSSAAGSPAGKSATPAANGQVTNGQANTATSAAGTTAAQPAEVPPPPDLSIPAGADAAALTKIVATAKKFVPRDPAQYKLQQSAIRDASQALMKAIEDKNDPVRMQAELDSLSSNAALMVNESEEARDKVLEKILAFLKSRKELSLADVQTGMIVGFHLELQPRKSPARDVYATLVELLEKDAREEMQAIRVNLQASVRRLEMLGNKFELNLDSLDGKHLKTEDYAGKFVVVDFFASWCAACISEVPRLKRHYEKYRSKGLEVVAISLDEDRKALDKYLEGAALPWPVVHDSATELKDKLVMRYGIASLPTVLLLNKEGVVVSLEARGPELDRLMERIFEAPTPAAAPQESPAKEK